MSKYDEMVKLYTEMDQISLDALKEFLSVLKVSPVRVSLTMLARLVSGEILKKKEKWSCINILNECIIFNDPI